MKAVKMMSLMMTLALTLFVSACSSDDDDVRKGIRQEELVGKWTLVPAVDNPDLEGREYWEFRADNTCKRQFYNENIGESLTFTYTYQIERGGYSVTMTNVANPNEIISRQTGKMNENEILWQDLTSSVWPALNRLKRTSSSK